MVRDSQPESLPPFLFAMELANRAAERPVCVCIGSPGKLANSWQMAFFSKGLLSRKVEITA